MSNLYMSDARLAELIALSGAAGRHVYPNEIDLMANEIVRRRSEGPVAVAIPMRLTCPSCGELHIDAGEFATKIHHTHACQHCGNVWRPAIVATVGVQFLPGFKDETP